MKKYVVPILLVIVLALGVMASRTNLFSLTVSHPRPSTTVGTTVTYQGVDGRTAMALLKANHQVQTKHYDFGDLVTVIDGQAADSTKYWILYVDGKPSEVGADALQTKTGQSIEWKLEKTQ